MLSVLPPSMLADVSGSNNDARRLRPPPSSRFASTAVGNIYCADRVPQTDESAALQRPASLDELRCFVWMGSGHLPLIFAFALMISERAAA